MYNDTCKYYGIIKEDNTNLPNIYSPGTPFGYSGYDGPAGHADDFVGFLTGDRIGIAWELDNRQTLAFELERGVYEIEYVLVDNQCLKANLNKSYKKGRLEFIMIEHKVLAGKACFARPIVFAESGCVQSHEEDCIVTKGSGGVTALSIKERQGEIRFAFAWDPASKETAVKKAREGAASDTDGFFAGRRAFYERLPACPMEDPLIERAYYKAFSVLKFNVQTPEGLFPGLWTTPDRLPHRNMWLWDSVFHSLALHWIDEDLAFRAVVAVMEQQREDGFIPHVMNPTGQSNITQPPLLAWAFHRIFTRTKNAEAIRPYLAGLRAYLDWDLKNRDRNNNFLCEWYIEGDPLCRSGESGMDNSPRFDKAAIMDAVDFSCFMKNEYDCLADMETALGLKAEAEKSRAMSARICESINKFLWNEKLGIYTDRYMDGELSDVMAVSGFLPMWAGIAGPEQAEKLKAHLENPDTFNTAMPVPTVSANDPCFSTDMWRGSVWLNYNYFTIEGLKRYGYNDLALTISQKTVNAVAHWYGRCGAIYEFYHTGNTIPPQALDRKGPMTLPVDIRRKYFPIADYGWTAAIYICLLLEDVYE